MTDTRMNTKNVTKRPFDDVEEDMMEVPTGKMRYIALDLRKVRTSVVNLNEQLRNYTDDVSLFYLCFYYPHFLCADQRVSQDICRDDNKDIPAGTRGTHDAMPLPPHY